MKKAILLLAMLLCVLLLAGCAAQDNNQFPEADTAMQRDPMSVYSQSEDDEYADDSCKENAWKHDSPVLDEIL